MGAGGACSRVQTVSVSLPRQPQIGETSSGSFLPPEAGWAEIVASDDEEDDDEDENDGSKGEDVDLAISSFPSVARDFLVHAKVMTEDFNDPHHCFSTGEIKPRRPLPMIKSSDMIRRLQNIRGRFILAGPLNDWPALVNLELISLACRANGGKISFGRKARCIWKKSDGSSLPDAATIPKRTRAHFHAPAWMNFGWSIDSPGFVWWYAAYHTKPPTCLFGENLRSVLQSGEYANMVATTVHAFAHRYPVEKGKETLRDQQAFHAGVLLEWNHKLFTTVVELAWLNGCGGYGGKSNWIEDKLASSPHLYKEMPDSMKAPWNCKRSEIRVLDMAFRNKDEFISYLSKYSEQGDLNHSEQRFLKPVVYASAAVRIRDCTPVQLGGYLLNYRSRVDAYVELKPVGTANCQTFAADLFSFLAGDPNAQPYSALIRPVYRQRTMSFLYKPKGLSDQLSS